MSLIFAPRPNRNELLLFQDLYFVKKEAPLKTDVKQAVCTICGKGLDDGVSVTAKIIMAKIKFYCQYHLPANF